MSNNCLKAKSFILLLLMKSNRQKQRFCHPKMADLKAWSHGVRKANSIGAKLLPVTTLQRKQYGVVLRNESTRRVYHNFGAFLSAGLNHCFGNKKEQSIFSLLEENLSKFCQNIRAKDVWQVAYLKSIFATTLVFDDIYSLTWML